MLVRGADDTTEYMGLGVNGSNGVLTAGASGSESTNMVFRTASSGTETTRMTLDSNGNLLVGKTTSDVGATEGFEWYDTVNVLTLTRDAGHALSVNRLNGSGDIIQFREDGGEIGSIGSYAGSYLQIGTGDTGLAFDVANSIRPVNMAGAQRDGAIDLGSSGARFKDLYLSGGVYVGGTAAANKLDGYEEGAWTPTVAGDATGAFSAAEGTYTKVGRLVFIEMYVVVSANFTSNYIGGLPFTVGDLLTGTSLGQSAVVLTNAADTVTGAALEGSGNMRFFNDHNTASFHNPDTTNGGYRLSLCYQAT